MNLAAVMYNPPCDAAALVPQPYAGQAPLPALQAPIGSELVPHGTIQQPDQASSTAVLVASASAADVAAHYAGRLSLAGWRLGETHVVAEHVVAKWSFVDPQGSMWRGALSVIGMDRKPSRHALTFFVTSSRSE